MLVIIISIVSLLLIFQLFISLILKRTINKSQYFYFINILILDFIFTILLILSSYFKWPVVFTKVFLVFNYLNISLFFLMFSKILEYEKKRLVKIISTIIVITPVIIIFFSNYLTPLISFILLISTLLLSVLLIFPRRNPGSNYFTGLLAFLFFNEVIRVLLLDLITIEFFKQVWISSWFIAIPFILKTMSVYIVVEIHDKLLVESSLRYSLDLITPASLLTTTFKEHPDAVVITDKDQKIVFVNPQGLANTGYTLDEVIGKSPKIFSSGLTDKSVYLDLKKHLREHHSWQGEFINKKKNGDIFTEQCKIITITDKDRNPLYYLAIKTDISNQKRYLKELEYLSKHDDLTGLLRRHQLTEMVIDHVLFNPDVNSYFLLIDLDNFKKINDKFGHASGDSALKHFAAILSKVFNNNSFTSRFGGDEFAVYLYDLTPLELDKYLEQLYLELEHSVVPNIDEDIHLEISGGLTIVKNNMRFREVFEESDKKLYLAKAHKGNYIKRDF